MRRALTTTGILAIMTFLGASCGRPDPNRATYSESPDTDPALYAVDIPVTPYQNQASTSSCWAYGTVAHLEQLYLRKTGLKVPLSEEYVAIQHQVHQLMDGRVLRAGGESFGALDYVGMDGIVPDSFFPLRLTNNIHTDVERVAAARRAELGVPAYYKFPETEARAIVEKALNTKIPTPDTSFTFDGKTVTPRQFASDILGFKRADFTTVVLANPDTDPATYQTQTRLIRKVMIEGLTVPFGYAWVKGYTSTSRAIDCPNCSKPTTASGGHIILLRDWRTASVPFGASSPEDLRRAYDEPVTEWNTKNSYGVSTTIHERFFAANARSLRLDRTTLGNKLDWRAAWANDKAQSYGGNWIAYVVVPSRLVTPAYVEQNGTLVEQEGYPAAYDTDMQW